MGFWDIYPQTDFHELNLDWLLRQWRAFLANNDDLRKDLTTLEAKVDSFIEYVDNYFDNLDITEEVRQILYEMSEDGTLGEAIRNYFEKALTSNDMDIQPLYHYVIRDGRDGSGVTYPVYQSLTATPYNTLITVSNDETLTNDNCMLREIDIDSGNIIRTAIIPGGHANGLTFANDKLYVCWMSSVSTGEDTDLISVIDYSTFTLIEYLNAGHNISGICYDPDNSRFYCKGIRSGDVYPIYMYDDNFTAIGSFTLDMSDAPEMVMNQDISYYNGMICGTGAFPSGFRFYDVDTKKLVKVYNPDQRIGVGVPFNEPETIEIAPNGNFYACAFARLDNHYSYNVIAKVNFQKNVYDGYIKNNRYSGNLDIYVDGDYTGIIMDGSEDFPFSHIGLAVAVLQSKTATTTPITVYCKKGTTVGSYSAHDINNVAIVGYDGTGDHYTLTGLRIARHSNFIVDSANIEYDSLNSTGTANVYVTHSTGKILNCIIDSTLNTDPNSIACFCQYSNIIYDSCTIDNGFTDGYRAILNSIISVSGGSNNAGTPARILTNSELRTNSRIKSPLSLWDKKFPAKTLTHVYNGNITAIGSYDITYGNVTNLENFSIALIEVCYGAGAAIRRELCPVLLADGTTKDFVITTTHQFTTLWLGSINGSIDLANKTITINEITTVNPTTNVEHKLSAGAQAGVAYPFISGIYFI